MYLLVNNNTDPGYNLALEEYFLRYRDDIESMVILWQNCPTVVIGKHQRAEEEVDLAAAKLARVPVIRRNTGGGAVYHDLGNVNYSFIASEGALDVAPTSIIAAALNLLGVTVEIGGRNDIFLNGKKISGYGALTTNGRTLHHGTLLFDVNIEEMTTLLQAGKGKYQGSAIESVSARVLNLKDFLAFADVKDFISALVRALPLDKVQPYILSKSDEREIIAIKEAKYDLYSWNFGGRSHFTHVLKKRFSWGLVEMCFVVRDNLIEELEIHGDFLEDEDFFLFTDILKGTSFEKNCLLQAISIADISERFRNAFIEIVQSVNKLNNSK